jgi:hypothetical protein
VRRQPYDEVAEVTLPPMQELLLSVVLGPTALFVVGIFFFLAGLFAPVEMARHGVSGFVRLRLLRIGGPWVLFTVLVWPLFTWFRLARHLHCPSPPPVTTGTAQRPSVPSCTLPPR